MDVVELYIKVGGVYQLCVLDGDDDNVLAISRAVNDIGDIQGRDGDFSPNFNAAMIPSNKLLFESAHVLISGTTLPYEKIPAYISKNGNPISFGYCLLLEVTDVFRLSYYGGNADWFKTMGDKKLSDLDLSALNHLWTAANVRDARLNNTVWTDAYTYPNVDYGPWQVGPTVYWTDFFPGVWGKYLLVKIIEEAGFTLAGDFIDNDTNLAKLHIPFCGRFIRDRNYDNRNSGEWNTPVSVYNGTTFSDDLVLTNTISQTHYNILNDASGIITILDKCELTFRIKVTVTNTDILPQAFAFRINYTDASGVLQNEVIIDNTTDPLDIPIPAGATKTFELTLTRDIDRTTITFDWLMLINPVTAVSVCEFEIISYVVDEETEDYLAIDETFNYITLASILPEVKQKDLLLTVFNQFCLMCDTDHQINYVNIFNFNTVLGNIPNAYDWSNKLDRSVTPRMRFVFNQYAQTNKFLYKDDPENEYLLAAPEFGGGEIEIANENLEVIKTVFQSEFASVIRQSESFSGTVRMAFIPKFPAGDEVDCEPYMGVIEFETIHLVTMDGYAVETTQPAMHEIGFSYLIPLYYGALETILTESKIVECLIMLSATDMNQLDFSKPVWIDYFNAYFYINAIQQFKLTSHESTTVQLVRL